MRAPRARASATSAWYCVTNAARLAASALSRRRLGRLQTNPGRCKARRQLLALSRSPSRALTKLAHGLPRPGRGFDPGRRGWLLHGSLQSYLRRRIQEGGGSRRWHRSVIPPAPAAGTLPPRVRPCAGRAPVPRPPDPGSSPGRLARARASAPVRVHAPPGNIRSRTWSLSSCHRANNPFVSIWPSPRCCCLQHTGRPPAAGFSRRSL
jgi:hypothetical protein